MSLPPHAAGLHLCPRTILHSQEIAQAKCSPSFEMEYKSQIPGANRQCLSYKGHRGSHGKEPQFQKRNWFIHSEECRARPWLGSSAFGVCITELRDGIINVLHAEEYPRPDFNQMMETTVRAS